MLLISPPYISTAMKTSWLGDSFGYENARTVSKDLPDWYKQLASMYKCEYLDAAEHCFVSDKDGCHLDAENQIKLGKAVYEHIKGLV